MVITLLYNENTKRNRYKYEKEHLKRVALDLHKEREYKPLKEYCEKHNIPVSAFIRQLIRDAIGNNKE